MSKKFIVLSIVLLVMILGVTYVMRALRTIEPEPDVVAQQQVVTFLQTFHQESTTQLQSLGVDDTVNTVFISDPTDGYHARVDLKSQQVTIYSPQGEALPRKYSILESVGSTGNSSGGLPAVYKGEIYFMNNGCTNTDLSFDCTAPQYLETSLDMGRTWNRESVTHTMGASFFIVHQGTFFQVYSAFCKEPVLGEVIPAIGNNYDELYVRSLEENGSWSTPQLILSTLGQLLGAYSYDQNSLLLIWRDERFYHANLCGLIPFIGCIDGEPTAGSYLLYRGLYDTKTKGLDELPIQKGDDFNTVMQYL